MTNQALAVRLLPFGMLLLVGIQTAQAIECSVEMPSNPSGHWSYRLIDGRKCWYQGQNNLSKSLLQWPGETSAPSTPDNALGGVDSRDSLLGANQIQGCFWGGSLGCDGTVGFERRGVGADSAADHRPARPERLDRKLYWL